MSNLEEKLIEFRHNENLEIPNALREKIDLTYKNLPKNKKYKKFINKTIKAAAIFIILILGVNFIEPTFAQEIPLIGPVLKVFNEIWGLGIEYSENVLEVNEIYETENYKMTIETVDFTGDRILITYKIDGKEIDKLIAADFIWESDVAQQGPGLSTGGVEKGAYYGYIITDFILTEETTELNFKIKPTILNIITEEGDSSEEIINKKEIDINIKKR